MTLRRAAALAAFAAFAAPAASAAAAAAPCAQVPDAPKAGDLLRAAQSCETAGDYCAAAGFAEKAAALLPASAPVWIQLADAAAFCPEPASRAHAAQALARAETLGVRDGASRALAASLYLQLDDQEGLRRSLRRLEDGAPADAESVLAVADSAAAKSRADLAERMVARALKAAPGDPAVLTRAASVESRIGRADRALELLLPGAGKDRPAAFHLELAGVALRSGRAELADSELALALPGLTGDAALARAAEIAAARGRYDQARSLAADRLRRDPDFDRLLLERLRPAVEALAAEGRLADALRAGAPLLAREPSVFQRLRERAGARDDAALLRLLGGPREAVDALAQARRITGGDPAIVLALARARHAAGDDAAARRDAADAVAASSATAQLLAAAQAQDELGDLASALKVYDGLTRRDPGDAEAFSRRGVAQFRLGRTRAAEASLRRAVELAPARAEPALNLAAVLSSRGHPADALAVCDRALAAAPADDPRRADLLRFRGELAARAKPSSAEGHVR